MDIRQLRYFAAVADKASFSAAAADCAIAQPSLSQQIAKLEDSLGTPLFDRLPRRVVPTEAGRRLQEHARRILTAVDSARRQVTETADRVAGRLAVGAIPTMAPYLLPATLRRFARRHPAVDLIIEEQVTESLLEQLRNGHLDLALLSLPINDENLHAELLFEEPLHLAMPPGHSLAKRKRIKWADLSGETFLVLMEMHCLGNQVMRFCQQAGSRPNVVFRGNQLATILQMVSMGLGVSLIPEMAARSDKSARRIYRPLAAPQPTRAVAVVWHLHRYRTNAARALVDELQHTAR